MVVGLIILKDPVVDGVSYPDGSASAAAAQTEASPAQTGLQ